MVDEKELTEELKEAKAKLKWTNEKLKEVQFENQKLKMLKH